MSRPGYGPTIRSGEMWWGSGGSIRRRRAFPRANRGVAGHEDRDHLWCYRLDASNGWNCDFWPARCYAVALVDEDRTVGVVVGPDDNGAMFTGRDLVVMSGSAGGEDQDQSGRNCRRPGTKPPREPHGRNHDRIKHGRQTWTASGSFEERELRRLRQPRSILFPLATHGRDHEPT